jgi:hypothetical protein
LSVCVLTQSVPHLVGVVPLHVMLQAPATQAGVPVPLVGPGQTLHEDPQ